jgi:hypothetical protein
LGLKGCRFTKYIKFRRDPIVSPVAPEFIGSRERVRALFHAEPRRSPREQADVPRRRVLALPTPTALRPPAQGWPRNEDNPGFAPNAGTNRIAVVAITESRRRRQSPDKHAGEDREQRCVSLGDLRASACERSAFQKSSRQDARIRRSHGVVSRRDAEIAEGNPSSSDVRRVGDDFLGHPPLHPNP